MAAAAARRQGEEAGLEPRGGTATATSGSPLVATRNTLFFSFIVQSIGIRLNDCNAYLTDTALRQSEKVDLFSPDPPPLGEWLCLAAAAAARRAPTDAGPDDDGELTDGRKSRRSASVWACSRFRQPQS